MYRIEQRYVCEDGTEHKSAEDAERHALARQIDRLMVVDPTVDEDFSGWIVNYLDVLAKLRDWPADAKQTVDEYLAKQNNKEG